MPAPHHSIKNKPLKCAWCWSIVRWLHNEIELFSVLAWNVSRKRYQRCPVCRAGWASVLTWTIVVQTPALVVRKIFKMKIVSGYEASLVLLVAAVSLMHQIPTRWLPPSPVPAGFSNHASWRKSICGRGLQPPWRPRWVFSWKAHENKHSWASVISRETIVILQNGSSD